MVSTRFWKKNCIFFRPSLSLSPPLSLSQSLFFLFLLFRSFLNSLPIIYCQYICQYFWSINIDFNMLEMWQTSLNLGHIINNTVSMTRETKTRRWQVGMIHYCIVSMRVQTARVMKKGEIVAFLFLSLIFFPEKKHFCQNSEEMLQWMAHVHKRYGGILYSFFILK